MYRSNSFNERENANELTIYMFNDIDLIALVDSGNLYKLLDEKKLSKKLSKETYHSKMGQMVRLVRMQYHYGILMLDHTICITILFV